MQERLWQNLFLIQGQIYLSLLIATAAANPTIITQLSMLETPCVAISLSAAA